MSFITRCPACGTAFKVVSDQLKISDGWVRCGQCQHIFDAMLDLQPWQADAELVDLAVTPTENAHPTVPVAAWPGTDASASVSPSEVETEPPRGDEDAVDVPAAGWPDRSDQGGLAVSATEAAIEPFWDETAVEAAVHTESSTLESMPSLQAEPRWTAEPEEKVSADSGWTPEPESLAFVRRAQRRAFWRRPVVRASLAVISGVLLLLLIVQWALLQRDALATQWPGLQPVLQVLCRPLGCEVGAGRQLESLSIDSSALLRRSPDRYAFDMVVKNAANRSLATPALELTLTDSQDQVLLRRVVLPSEWPQVRATLAERSESPVRLELTLSGSDTLPVVGYRAVLFYP